MKNSAKRIAVFGAELTVWPWWICYWIYRRAFGADRACTIVGQRVARWAGVWGEAAALIEPLAVGVRGMNRLGTFAVDRLVLIFGDGPIGLLMAMFLVRRQVKDLTLVGGRPYRLELAKQIGVKTTINYHEDVSDLPRNYFSKIVEASGSVLAMKTVFNAIAPCGKIVVLGDYKKAYADFAWNTLLHKEIEMIGSNAIAGAWLEAVQLAVEANMPLEKLITQRIPAGQFM